MLEFGPVDTSPYVPDNTMSYGYDPRLFVEGMGVVLEAKKSPGTEVGLDINATVLPSATGVPNFKGVAKNLFPCHYCNWTDGQSKCIFLKNKVQFEFFCDIVNVDARNRTVSSKECRHNLYYQMAMTCLIPFDQGEEKKLPHCIVDEVQKKFPDKTGRHLVEEALVFFFRDPEAPMKLFLETRRKPVAHRYYV